MSGLLEKDICLLLRGHRNMLILFFMICEFLGLGQPGPNIQRITPEYFTDDEGAELNDLYGVTLDADTWNTYQNADTYGSLIQPPTELAALASVPSDEGAVERKRD